MSVMSGDGGPQFTTSTPYSTHAQVRHVLGIGNWSEHITKVGVIARRLPTVAEGPSAPSIYVLPAGGRSHTQSGRKLSVIRRRMRLFSAR